ncbi:MAG: hydrogenase maturation nickel metallochaperone HypA [Verrucomicrobiae bacterium]|nr:hydrogenase maturation nickel metallochaperone HypA [Verrucomicrobiae bacterium]
MHEVGIMANVLRIAEETARRNEAERILRLKVRIGVMSGVVMEALEFAFEALKKGTMAEGADLDIDVVSASCWCEECKIEYEPDEIDFLCPKCGGGNIKLQKGREMELVSIDYE